MEKENTTLGEYSSEIDKYLGGIRGGGSSGTGSEGKDTQVGTKSLKILFDFGIACIGYSADRDIISENAYWNWYIDEDAEDYDGILYQDEEVTVEGIKDYVIIADNSNFQLNKKSTTYGNCTVEWYCKNGDVCNHTYAEYVKVSNIGENAWIWVWEYD